jgi:hypothetical protein
MKNIGTSHSNKLHKLTKYLGEFGYEFTYYPGWYDFNPGRVIIKDLYSGVDDYLSVVKDESQCNENGPVDEYGINLVCSPSGKSVRFFVVTDTVTIGHHNLSKYIERVSIISRIMDGIKKIDKRFVK